jgi:hypothetical protein
VCVFHAEDQQERGRLARANGARKANVLRSIAGQRARLSTAADLLRFTTGLVHRTVEGELTPDTARAAFYGLSLARQLIETAEIERRLRLVERRQAGQRWA